MTNEITELRKELGLSKTQFSKILGVSPSAATRWEQGATVPLPIVEAAMKGLRKKLAEAKADGTELNLKKTIFLFVKFGTLPEIMAWIFSSTAVGTFNPLLYEAKK